MTITLTLSNVTLKSEYNISCHWVISRHQNPAKLPYCVIGTFELAKYHISPKVTYYYIPPMR